MSQIYELIPRVMADLSAVGKNRKNEQQKYAFRGVEDFYNAAHPALVKHGVFCVPEVLEHTAESFDKTSEYGKTTTWRHVTIKVNHRFYAPDGSSVSVVTMGEGLDNSDKATNKAMSGAMKYAFIELFSVPTEDVEDADRTSPETGRRGKPVETTTEDEEIGAPGNGSGAEGGRTKGRSSSAKAPKAAGSTGPEAPAPASPSPAPDNEERISIGQQKNFHIQFRNAVRPAKKMEADNLCYQWLLDHKYVNDDGEPTAAKIPAAGWLTIRDAACEWAARQ